MKIVRPDKLRTMKQTIKRIHYASAFYSEDILTAVEYYEEGIGAPTIMGSDIVTAGPFNSAIGSRNTLKLHSIVTGLEGMSSDTALLVQKDDKRVVYNGDFESSDFWAQSSVAGWYLETEGGSSTASLNTSEKHSGTRSLELSVDGSDNYVKATASTVADPNNVMYLAPEGMYTLKFWHKSNADGVLSLILSMPQSDGTLRYLQADGSWDDTPNIAISTTTDWSEYTINFQAQDLVRLMQAPVYELSIVTGQGSADIDYFLDDFMLTPQVDTEADLAYFDKFILHRGTVTKAEYDEEAPTTTLTIDDAIVIAGTNSYGGLALEYPVTIEGLIEGVASSITQEVEPIYDPTLPNLSYSLATDAFANIQGYMVRDFVADIAETTGSVARISPTGALQFTAVDMTPVDTITHTEMSKLKVIATTGVINQLSLSRQPQDDNIVVTDEGSAAVNGLKTYRIANNWIMDGDRNAFIQNLFDNVFNGVEYYTGQIETIGLCYFDVGDVVTADNGGSSYNMMVTEISQSFQNGGIKETITSVAFDDGSTNQLTAGSVLTTLYNTKIQVDHQNNSIESLVAEYTSLESSVSSQFTQVLQTLENITTTIQSTGGGNQIQNSVGFSQEGNEYSHWVSSGTGEITSQDSPASLAFGAVSGHSISVTGPSKKISQRIPVTLGGAYSISFYANKTTAGNVTIRLSNSVDNHEFELLSGTIYAWTFFYEENITAGDVYFDIEIESSGAADFSITDLMLVVGAYRQVWSQFNGEILNTSVQIDTRGIRVYSDTNVGSYTMMTPSEFASYDSNNQVAFRANNDTIEVNNFTSSGDTYYPDARVFVRQGSDGLSYFIRDPA